MSAPHWRFPEASVSSTLVPLQLSVWRSWREPVSTRMPCPKVEVAVVESMSRAPAAMLMPAWVKVEEAVPLTVRMEPMSAVEEAEKAPPTSRESVMVEEAEEMRPESKTERPSTLSVEEASRAPVAPIAKRRFAPESPKMRMSPVCPSVVEARIKAPSVEVAKRVRRELVALSAAAVVDVPT